MDPNLAHFLHLGFRFYEPEVARFSQLDPIRDGMNWYAYVEGRPLKETDPDGLAVWYQWGWPLYTHAWLEFEEISCRGHKSAGFWPGEPGDTGRPGDNVRMPDSYEGKEGKRREVKRKAGKEFEEALCKCIEESINRGDKWSFPFFTCGTWARKMWNCALRGDSRKRCIPQVRGWI